MKQFDEEKIDIAFTDWNINKFDSYLRPFEITIVTFSALQGMGKTLNSFPFIGTGASSKQLSS